jgi:hypothetical protein
MGNRYINFEIDAATTVRVYRTGEYVDNPAREILAAYARKEHGRTATVWGCRVESWSSVGSTHAITVVGPPARGQNSLPVWGEHRIYLDREEVARVGRFLGVDA